MSHIGSGRRSGGGAAWTARSARPPWRSNWPVRSRRSNLLERSGNLKQGAHLPFLLNTAYLMEQFWLHTKGSPLDGDWRRSPDPSGTLHHPAHGLPGVHAGTPAATARTGTGRRASGPAFRRRPRAGSARRLGAHPAEPGPVRLHVCAQGGGALQPDRGHAKLAAGPARRRGASGGC